MKWDSGSVPGQTSELAGTCSCPLSSEGAMGSGTQRPAGEQDGFPSPGAWASLGPGGTAARVGLSEGRVERGSSWRPRLLFDFSFPSNLQSVNISLGFYWLQVSVWLTVLIFLCHICVLSAVCLEFRVFVIFEQNDGVCCQLLCRGRGKERCVAFPVLQAFAPSFCPSQKDAGVWAHGSVRTLRPEVGQ